MPNPARSLPRYTQRAAPRPESQLVPPAAPRCSGRRLQPRRGAARPFPAGDVALRGSGSARRPTARPRCSDPQLCTHSCCVSPALPVATCTPLSTCRRQAESFYFHPHSWRQGLGAEGGSAAFPFQPGQCPSRGCGIFHSGELWSLVRAEFGPLRHVTVAVTSCSYLWPAAAGISPKSDLPAALASGQYRQCLHGARCVSSQPCLHFFLSLFF